MQFMTPGQTFEWRLDIVNSRNLTIDIVHLKHTHRWREKIHIVKNAVIFKPTSLYNIYLI